MSRAGSGGSADVADESGGSSSKMIVVRIGVGKGQREERMLGVRGRIRGAKW